MSFTGPEVGRKVSPESRFEGEDEALRLELGEGISAMRIPVLYTSRPFSVPFLNIAEPHKLLISKARAFLSPILRLGEKQGSSFVFGFRLPTVDQRFVSSVTIVGTVGVPSWLLLICVSQGAFFLWRLLD
jgi:hypothetical protein